VKKRSISRDFQKGTAEYVIAHALYRLSRGRRPVATLGNIRNPVKALEFAYKLLCADTLFGITAMTYDLESLNEILKIRQEASYKHGLHLKSFMFRGQWVMDSRGNFGRITGNFIPREQFPNLPNVISMQRFWGYAQDFVSDPDRVCLNVSHGTDGIPPLRIKCAKCGKTWTIEDCHDTAVVRESEIIPMNQFVGRTLGWVRRHFSCRDDAIYFLQPDKPIRNDEHIDLSPDPNFSRLKVNEFGWLGSRHGIDDSYVIKSGDEAYFNVWRYYHTACNDQKLKTDMREYFRKIFQDAGFEKIRLLAVKNQYCSCQSCAPWFRVSTEMGIFTIGWRKRVINIDWSDIKSVRIETHTLFSDENVTKADNYIHAWGAESATEYLTRLRGLQTNQMETEKVTS